MNLAMIGEIFAVRRRVFVLLAVVALADLALVLNLSVWQKPALERTLSEWSAKRDAAARGTERSATLRYRDAERDLVKVQDRFILKKEFAAYLSDLFGMAKGNSLRLKGISYKPAVIKDEGLVTYGLSFTVTGKYAAVKSFIADLVRFPKMVTLDSISLDSGSQTEEIVNLKVQLTVYLKPEGA